MRVSSVIEGMGTGPDPSTEGKWPVSCSLALASAKKRLFFRDEIAKKSSTQTKDRLGYTYVSWLYYTL